MTLEQQKFPIGHWIQKDTHTEAEIKRNLSDLLSETQKLIELTSGLSDDYLERTYREGSWTIRQLVHHLADTHLWHFIRLKHALTEDNPTGFVANMNAFAATPDASEAPIKDSLAMLQSTHNRYHYLFERIDLVDYTRTYYHPVRQLTINIPQTLGMTVWHLKHHLAHIKLALA